MAIVAGVDFGTLSVRVTLLDSERGRLGTSSAGYPLHRRKEDPDFATQSHHDQMQALAAATRQVLAETGVAGANVENRDSKHYGPLTTAPTCPVVSLASSFAASSGVGFSVSARRH